MLSLKSNSFSPRLVLKVVLPELDIIHPISLKTEKITLLKSLSGFQGDFVDMACMSHMLESMPSLSIYTLVLSHSTWFLAMLPIFGPMRR